MIKNLKINCAGFGLGIKAFRAHAPPCNPGRLQGRYFKSWGPISMVSILICLRHLIRCLVLQIRGIPRVGIAIVIRTYGQRAVRAPKRSDLPAQSREDTIQIHSSPAECLQAEAPMPAGSIWPGCGVGCPITVRGDSSHKFLQVPSSEYDT